MKHGSVSALFIAPTAGAPMQEVEMILALEGQGLNGDRYASGSGSWNKGAQGTRQVTLINGMLFPKAGFTWADTRRNIVTNDVELMYLIGKEFQIGTARMRGIKYCDPCARPSKLAGIEGFREAFMDRGGLVAEVVTTGIIRI